MGRLVVALSGRVRDQSPMWVLEILSQNNVSSCTWLSRQKRAFTFAAGGGANFDGSRQLTVRWLTKLTLDTDPTAVSPEDVAQK